MGAFATARKFVTGSVGPEDVDAAGELAPNVNDQNKGHLLIAHVRASHPVELTTLQQRAEDIPRSKTLDKDEVTDAAIDAFGDEDAKGGIVRILSARVRGKNQAVSDKAVLVLWETASGRTARGAIPYAPMEESQVAYEEGIAAGTVTEGDEEDPKDLQRQVKRLEEANRRMAAGGAAQGGSSPPAGVSAKDIRKMVAEAVSEATEEAIASKDQEIEALRAELAAKAEGESPTGANGHPDTTDTKSEDAADAASTTVAEVEAGAAAAKESAKAEAPTGNAKDLIAAVGDYSDAQLEALVADSEAKTVVKAAKAELKKRADAGK